MSCEYVSNYKGFKTLLENELLNWFDQVELSVRKGNDYKGCEIFIFKDDEDEYYRYLSVEEVFELYLTIEDLEYILEQLLWFNYDELPIYFEY